MRKLLIILIIAILPVVVSGCGSVPAAQDKPNGIDAVNAIKIKTGINAYNALRVNNTHPISDDTTLEDAKAALGEGLWEGLSDEQERAAWELIAIKDGEADLTPEALQALQAPARDAWRTALAINAHNALFPCCPLGCELPYGCNVTLEDAKDTVGEELWPAGLSDEEERAAWELIVYRDCVADLALEAEQALQEGNSEDSNDLKTADASMITLGINVYSALNPASMLPDNVTLAEVKETLGEYLWPPFLTNAEAEEAWKLIEIKGGVAEVKGEG